MTSPFVRHPSLICALLAIGCHDSGDAKSDVSASVAVQPEEGLEETDITDDAEEDGTTTPDGDTGSPMDADEDATDEDTVDETPDADGDGLSDAVEAYIGSDPTNPDTDGDGLKDGDEIHLHGSDPLCEDTDGDGIDDDMEVDGGSDPSDPDSPRSSADPAPDCLATDAEGDAEALRADEDEDGLTLEEEIDCGTIDAYDPDDPGFDPRDTDSDGLGDAVECVSTCLDANDWDTDGDGLADGFEDGLGYDPCAADGDGDGLDDYAEHHEHETDPTRASSDADALSDYEELITHGTDPWDEDTDDDGLSDSDELDPANACDPLDADTDDDGLLDGDEVASGTDCTDEDSDGGGMPDGIEVAAGKDPTTRTDDVAYVGVNETWQCTSMSAASVTFDPSAGIDEFAFDNDELYYSTALARDLSEFTGTECVCNDVFVGALAPVAIAGITVWTEQSVHITDIGHASRTWGGGWAPGSGEDGAETAIASAVAVTPGWSGQALSEYASGGSVAGALEVGNDSDGDAAWMAFDASPVVADGLGSTMAIDVNGAVDLRVSYGSPSKDPIQECGEFTYVAGGAGGDDHGLQFRVDALSAAARTPPAYLPAHDPHRCVPGDKGASVFGFVAAHQGGRAPLLLKGSRAYGHATVDRLRVHDWRGSEWLTLQHRDGRVFTLHKGQPGGALPGGAPWSLAEVTWTMGRDSEGGFAEPVVGVEHSCSGEGPMPGPVPVEGYQISYAAVEQVLSGLGLAGVLQARWPQLAELSHTVLRARIIVPDVWVNGPTQAALRIDVAGGPTVLSLPLDPVLAPSLRSITPPADVRSWTIQRSSAQRAVQARLTQTPAGLTVALDRLTIGGREHTALEAPLSFTLPVE